MYEGSFILLVLRWTTSSFRHSAITEKIEVTGADPTHSWSLHMKNGVLDFQDPLVRNILHPSGLSLTLSKIGLERLHPERVQMSLILSDLQIVNEAYVE